MGDRRCSVDGCLSPWVAKGLCSMHYQRLRFKGDVGGLHSRVSPLLARINKTPTCWLWTGAPSNSGYGHYKVGGKAIKAHRAVYELLVGPIPEGMQLDHLCEVKLCVNPDHLEPVTHQENARRHYDKSSLCRNGLHPKVPENLHLRGGKLTCIACDLATRARTESKRLANKKKGGVL